MEAIELIIPLFTKWTANSRKKSEISFGSGFLHAIAPAASQSGNGEGRTN
jgi:hypothetical protein